MKNDGLYADGCAWINKDMKSNRKYCILAEEIGHYETSVGNILDQEKRPATANRSLPPENGRMKRFYRLKISVLL
ncbi:MAG: hypothetical protein ACLRYB_18370 [Segatella copri]